MVACGLYAYGAGFFYMYGSKAIFHPDSNLLPYNSKVASE